MTLALTGVRWKGWAAGALWMGVLWAWLVQRPILNADVLYLYDLGVSLKKDGWGLYWVLPPGPSLVPDLGVSLLAQAIAPLPEAWQRAYSLLMGLWAWFVVARLNRAFFGVEPGLAEALAAAGLTLCLALGGPDYGPNVWLLPSHHGSAFMISLMLYTWALGWDGLSGRAWGLVLGSLGLGLVLGSDRFVGLWALPPLALLSLRLRGDQARRLALGALLALAVSQLSFHALDALGSWVVPQPWRALVSADWHQRMQAAATLGERFSGRGGLLLGMVAGFMLWALRPSGRSTGGRRVLGGVVIASAATLALLGFTQNFDLRYLYLLVSLPVMLLPGLLVERWPRVQGGLLAAWVLLALLGACWWLGWPGAVPQERRQAAWLDSVAEPRGWQRGWAGYWQARPLRLLCHVPLFIVPFKPDADKLLAYPWIADLSLFADHEALVHPDFVVVNGLPDAAVTAEFGPPKEVVQGEGLRVFGYRGSAARNGR